MFEDLVCAMMLHIRNQAQTQVPMQSPRRYWSPINFQGWAVTSQPAGTGYPERAAHRAGFRDVVFQYEPVAAGLDFEATLTEEKRVLVVDIGGGTTDCSLLLMGPHGTRVATVKIACWGTVVAAWAVTIWISLWRSKA
jgi:hypothetical chaperone protein